MNNNYDSVQVFYNDSLVGFLFKEDNYVSFRYSDEWLKNGFSLSPILLPLEDRTFIPRYGIHEVFYASNPPKWQSHVIDKLTGNPNFCKELSNWLKLFATFNYFGIKALHYKPKADIIKDDEFEYLCNLSEQYKKIIYCSDINNLDEIFNTPFKNDTRCRQFVIANINGEEWFIKSSSSFNNHRRGEEEYLYFQYAKECGINVPEFKLFESKNNSGYIGTKLYDVYNNKKLHSISYMELSYIKNIPYKNEFRDIINATAKLTQSQNDVEQMFKFMCLCVFAQNRDSNSSNFNYIYDENIKRYKLAPATDFEYSDPNKKEHEAGINKNKINPSLDDILAVASQTGIDLKWAKETALDIQNKSKLLLKKLGH